MLQILLIDKDKIYSETLPVTVSGQYWIRDLQKKEDAGKILAIDADGINNAWVVKTGKYVKGFRGNEQQSDKIFLEPGRKYTVCLGQEFREAYLIVEEENESFQHFTKFRVNEGSRLTVGREGSQTIQLNNAMVSSLHFVLSFQNSSWAIMEAPGQNGTYVNSYKTSGAIGLKPGDVISVLFYKIIIGSDFIAINNPNSTVTIHGNFMVPFGTQKEIDEKTVPVTEKVYFYRSPRLLETIPVRRIKVDMPIGQDKKDNTPILLTIAPAMLMGLASVSTSVISIVNILEGNGNLINALPMALMSVSMLGGMILFPTIMKNREKRRNEEREQERRNKYLNYLSTIKNEIEKEKKNQQKRRNDQQPPILTYVEKDNFWVRNLWERTVSEEDFLSLRLGSGNIDMDLDISFPEERFTIEEDILHEEMLKLQHEDKVLMDVPIAVNLVKSRVFGVIGDRQDVNNMLNNILLQIMLLHSYDEVKVIFLHDEADEQFFEYTRRAQHLWDDKKNRRFLAVSDNNIRELNVEISNIFCKRKNEIVEKDKEVLPHYIIISTSKEMSNKCSFISDFIGDNSIKGISMVCAYDEIRNLPKECHVFATVAGGMGILYSDGIQTGFMEDIVPINSAKKYIGRMSNYTLDLQQGKYDLPEMMTFMEMFRVGNIEHLNILQRWKENNPVKSLRTPVGMDTNGEVFYLDLHEKFHGPHGLVAGMTGSGKSEFLITYILSMAINYHPNEVSFVLIDYKGGGLASAFDNEHYKLPHLAGTITNLDGNAVMRSILSIKSELRKRQTIFNRALSVANEGTMDIYKYQKLYRDGKVKEAVPHLFIIADEFAELKSQQPEFLEQLISTARIGRSLGVHLILATQKPSGVVSEQIWANSKFKVCLKVQDRADSLDMLKRPDAAEIVETGRFYLQVGYNEMFELGQSAWCGAPYVESREDADEINESIELIDELGNVVENIKDRTLVVTQNGKQIVRIMQHLKEIAELLKLQECHLWQPELPAVILADEIKAKYSMVEGQDLQAVIGEVDDPYTQSRHSLTVNFTEKGNLLLYGTAGSGKEMFLMTLMYVLYSAYSAKDLNVYALDFGAETLRAFEKAPQTGSVVLDGEDDKIDALFTYLPKEIRRRKKVLSDYGGGIGEYRASNTDMPYILLIVNNYAQFMEEYEQYEERLVNIAREGQKFGIYIVLTATNSSTVRYRMAQNFTNVMVLQLNDKSEYITILGNTGGVYPSAVKGRGIIKDGETYTFQVARITEQETQSRELIKKFCDFLRERGTEGSAMGLQIAPNFLSGQELRGKEWSLNSFPIGIDLESCEIESINLFEKGVCWILSEDSQAGIRMVKGSLEAMLESDTTDILVVAPNVEEKFEGHRIQFVENVEEKILELFETAVDRNNHYKSQQTISSQALLVILKDYAALKEILSEDAKDKLRLMLSKVEYFWHIAFLVCDSYQNTGKYSLEEWVRTKCSNNGIWIGTGVSRQIRFNIKSDITTSEQGVDDTTGFVFEGDAVKKIRVVLEEKERREK